MHECMTTRKISKKRTRNHTKSDLAEVYRSIPYMFSSARKQQKETQKSITQINKSMKKIKKLLFSLSLGPSSFRSNRESQWPSPRPRRNSIGLTTFSKLLCPCFSSAPVTGCTFNYINSSETMCHPGILTKYHQISHQVSYQVYQ